MKTFLKVDKNTCKCGHMIGIHSDATNFTFCFMLQCGCAKFTPTKFIPAKIKLKRKKS